MDTEEIIRSPDTLRPDRIPPGQHERTDWPVLHYGAVPRIELSQWTFTARGLVEEERSLSYREFQALPRVKVLSDIHCVTTWTILDNMWEGVSTAVIKDLCHPHPEARFVIVHAAAGFSTNLPLDDFFQPDVLFADMRNGDPLSAVHGYPWRLVVPRLYFWKSAKWVSGLEFVARDRPGFWEANGYHMRGDPWREERYGV